RLAPVLFGDVLGAPANASTIATPKLSATRTLRGGEVITTSCDGETRIERQQTVVRCSSLSSDSCDFHLNAPARNGEIPVGRKVRLTWPGSAGSSRRPRAGRANHRPLP